MTGYLAAFVLGLYIMPWIHVTAAIINHWDVLVEDGRGGRRPLWHPCLNVLASYALAPYVAFREMSR